MSFIALLRRLSLGAQVSLSLSLLTLSAVLISAHSTSVRDMRDIGLPAAVELPHLQHRANVLAQQAEVATVQSLLRGGAAEELMRLYVVPDSEDLTRVLTTLDTLSQFQLQHRKMSHIEPIRVDEAVQESDAFTATPIHIEADMTEDGLAELLLFIRISGMQTIADTLSANDQKQLLSLTEEENPAAIIALEQFLSIDLLRELRDPKPFRDALLRSFSSTDRAEQVRGILDQSSLGRVHALLSGALIERLVEAKVWPIRLMRLAAITTENRGDTIHVSLTLDVYGRAHVDLPPQS